MKAAINDRHIPFTFVKFITLSAVIVKYLHTFFIDNLKIFFGYIKEFYGENT